MKQCILLLTLLLSINAIQAQSWSYSGDIYAGGGTSTAVKYDIDGNESKDSTYFGEGTLTLSANNTLWYMSLYSEMNRDVFYQETQGKFSLALVNSSAASYRMYTSYKNKNDITDSDNDHGVFSLYGETIQYFTDRFYFHAYTNYTGTAYKEQKNELYDYRSLEGSMALTYTDYALRITAEKQSYDTGSLTPDYMLTSMVLSASLYHDTIVSGNSLTYETKTYDFFTSDYTSYQKIDIATRSGYRLSPTAMVYILGGLLLHSEDVYEGVDGSYLEKRIGIEASVFSFPLTLICEYKRVDYETTSSEMDKTNKNVYTVDVNWSYWNNRLSLYLSNAWELQKVEDITESDYPEAKNSNYSNTSMGSFEYAWSDVFKSNVDVSTEIKKHFLEDEMNANYFMYSIKNIFEYVLSFSYSIRLETTYTQARYETFSENDTKELSIKTMVRYYF